MSGQQWSCRIFSLHHCVPGRSQSFFYVFNDILAVNNLEVETDCLNVSGDLYISLFQKPNGVSMWMGKFILGWFHLDNIKYKMPL